MDETGTPISGLYEILRRPIVIIDAETVARINRKAVVISIL